MAMSVAFNPADRILTVRVSDRLTGEQWQAAQRAAADRLKEWSADIRVLVIVEADFAGWDRRAGAWDESPFQSRFDRQTARMAIVGQKKWEDLVLMFVGKGLRRVEIEYFQPADVAGARQWLIAAAAREGDAS